MAKQAEAAAAAPPAPAPPPPRSPLIAVRALTCFVVLRPRNAPASWEASLRGPVSFLARLAARVRAGAKLEVQSLRIITNPFAEYLDVASEDAALASLAALQAALAAAQAEHRDLLDGTRVRFSIGAATSRAFLEPYSCSTKHSAHSMDVPGPRDVTICVSTTTRHSL